MKQISEILEILTRAFQERFLRIFQFFPYIYVSLYYINVFHNAQMVINYKVPQGDKQSTRKGLLKVLGIRDVWFKYKCPSDSGIMCPVNSIYSY